VSGEGKQALMQSVCHLIQSAIECSILVTPLSRVPGCTKKNPASLRGFFDS